MKLNVTKYFRQTAVITVYRLYDRLVDKSLLFIYIHFKSGIFLYLFSHFQIFSATHAPTHYLWFAPVETQTETRLSIKQTFIYHCSHTLQAKKLIKKCPLLWWITLHSRQHFGEHLSVTCDIPVCVPSSPSILLQSKSQFANLHQMCQKCHLALLFLQLEERKKKTPHWFVTQSPVVRSKPKGKHVLVDQSQIYVGNLHE